MPLFALKCRKCEYETDSLLKSKDEAATEACAQCGTVGMDTPLTSHGGYTIKGNNGASTKPRKFKARG